MPNFINFYKNYMKGVDHFNKSISLCSQTQIRSKSDGGQSLDHKLSVLEGCIRKNRKFSKDVKTIERDSA